MNIASLELSKTLFGLSEWGKKLGETDFYALDKKGKQVALVREGKIIGELSLDAWHKSVPAYSLGYLIRKLPRRIDEAALHIHIMDNVTTNPAWEGWRARYMYLRANDKYGTTKYCEDADTPEDAACKLAIELFKQGILTKESEKA